MKLPPYHIYTSFNQNGRSTGWVSGRTLPPPEPFRDPLALKRYVAARYGMPGFQVEQEYLEMLAECRAAGEPESRPRNEPEVEPRHGRRPKG
jgi:hypothetical protein